MAIKVNMKVIMLMLSQMAVLNYVTRAFWVGSTGGGGGWHKVPAAFFSETVIVTAIKLGTQTILDQYQLIS